MQETGDLFSISKFCDAVLIATPDNLYYEPAVEAIELGYKILLEKPISNNIEECIRLDMLFEDGITVAFTMCAFTKDCTRTIKITGTKGEIRGDMEKNTIEVLDFLSGGTQTVSVATEGGHSGGDESIMKKFTESVYSNGNKKTLTDISYLCKVILWLLQQKNRGYREKLLTLRSLKKK